MVEGVAYLMLPAIAMFFGYIVLHNLIELFLRTVEFVTGRR
jgi:hypothetical protein